MREERLHAPRKEAQEERVRDEARRRPAGPVRRAAGYTQESPTERIRSQYDTIASIEQGRRPLKSDLSGQLDALLDTKGAPAVAVANMPEMNKYPIWAARTWIARRRRTQALNLEEIRAQLERPLREA